MTVQASQELSPEEVAALASAATWYAKYHARIIAEKADDESAAAHGQRERYEQLLSALHKLGIRLPSVEMLRDDIAGAEPESARRAA